jgi:hypothetical protein
VSLLPDFEEFLDLDVEESLLNQYCLWEIWAMQEIRDCADMFG